MLNVLNSYAKNVNERYNETLRFIFYVINILSTEFKLDEYEIYNLISEKTDLINYISENFTFLHMVSKNELLDFCKEYLKKEGIF